MKLIQLRYLVAVAENDINITQAAGGSETQNDVDREIAPLRIPFLR